MEKKDLLGDWKCPNCLLSITNDELQRIELSEINEGNSQPEAYLSLADEINKSILQENEDLRQQLHETKNNSSYYVLELEDRLKQNEEDITTHKMFSDKKDQEFLEKIKSLEIKLEYERKTKEKLISQVEEERRNSTTNINHYVQTRTCDNCVIYKEETANMLSTIRSLENVTKILERKLLENQEIMNKRGLGDFTCLSCFPPLADDIQKNCSVVDKWQKVPARYSRRPDKPCTREPASLVFTSNNRFSALAHDSKVNAVEEEEYVIRTNNNSTIISHTNHKNINRKTKGFNIQKEDSSHSLTGKKIKNIKTQKILLYADSHGRNLAFYLNKCSTSFNAFGFIRPGGLSEQILSCQNIDGERLGADDVLIIACGANDVARNEANKALNSITNILEKYAGSRIVLLDIPVRHDLRHWSCVNEEIRNTNLALEALSNKFINVSLVKTSSARRHLHTKHGMHLNNTGKLWIARRICDMLSNSDSDTEHSSSQSRGSSQVETEQSSPPKTESQGSEDGSSSTISIADTDSIPGSEPPVPAEGEESLPGNFSPSHPAPPP